MTATRHRANIIYPGRYPYCTIFQLIEKFLSFHVRRQRWKKRLCMSLPSRHGQLAGRAKASFRALLPLPHRKFTPFFLSPQIFHQFFSKIFNFPPFPPILCPNSTPSGGPGALAGPVSRWYLYVSVWRHPSAPYTQATLRAAPGWGWCRLPFYT